MTTQIMHIIQKQQWRTLLDNTELHFYHNIQLWQMLFTSEHPQSSNMHHS